jgi:hypothetical protein
MVVKVVMVVVAVLKVVMVVVAVLMVVVDRFLKILCFEGLVHANKVYVDSETIDIWRC